VVVRRARDRARGHVPSFDQTEEWETEQDSRRRQKPKELKEPAGWQAALGKDNPEQHVYVRIALFGVKPHRGGGPCATAEEGVRRDFEWVSSMMGARLSRGRRVSLENDRSIQGNNDVR